MVRIVSVTGLEDRKRALVAESEVYRQTLKLELHNVRLYTYSLQQRFGRFRSLASPWLLVASLGGLLGFKFITRPKKQPRSGLRRLLTTAMMGWRLYRRFSPLITSTLRRRSAPESAEEQAPAPRV